MAGGPKDGLFGALRRRWQRGAPPRALLAFLPRVRPVGTAVLGVLTLLSGLLPVAFVVASGNLVGAVPPAVSAGAGTPEAHRLLWLVIVTGIVFTARQVVEPLRMRAGWELGWWTEVALRQRLMRATTQPPGIAHLEDPRTLDRIALARGIDHQFLSPSGAIDGMANVATRYLTTAGSFVVVSAWHWWIGAAVFLAYLIFVTRCRDHFRALLQVVVGETETFRRADYTRGIALTPQAAKEVRIFGLGGWLADRYRADMRSALLLVWRARAQFWKPFVTGVVFAAGVRALAIIAVVRAGARGELSLTQSVAIIQALIAMAQFSAMGNDDLVVTQGSAPVPAVLSLENDVAEVIGRTATGTLPAAGLPAREIRFDDVHFAYPGSGVPVFAGLDLTIHAGRSLAIVGVNGAGKTTLVKLLARLYEPTTGRITVDGLDLADLDAPAWQRRIAAIFQDFVHYELSAADNIGLGAPELLEDRAVIERAADRAGVRDVIDELPHGFDSILNRQYADGVELSGGEWQRIGLARALHAVAGGAGVLVLDEPTANLDVRAEARLYDRFLDITSGLTSIVISHRFSTVRRADRIVVLEAGGVIEDGTHDELLAQGGRYAAMYALQSARFASAPVAIGEEP